MSNSNYFNQALHDMVFENACGAAIKRLADKSFPISYIVKELDYPISFERVQKYVWQYYIDNKTLIYLDDKTDYTETNGIIIINEHRIKKTYIKEHGNYGKATFRQVIIDETSSPNNRLENITERKYIACNFGVLKNNNPSEYEHLLKKLYFEDKSYIKDLPWNNKLIYHILNDRMLSIIKSLNILY
ncbi:MAG: hypothetical protein IJ054_01435 [Lachnospiraceae bacterium]|nr:hypothetical protein [Lachnospiraceae bacterium]